jgi:hypothetical protein
MAMRIETFVMEQNFTHFRQQLERGVDPPTRATVFKLLVEQLELLGLSDQQLGKINRHIERLGHLITKHVELIEELRLDGHDLERPVMLLSALNELMSIYQKHRQQIIAAIASGCPGADPR